MSASRFVGQPLEKEMREASRYDTATTRVLSVLAKPLKKGGVIHPATRCMNELRFVDTSAEIIRLQLWRVS